MPDGDLCDMFAKSTPDSELKLIFIYHAPIPYLVPNSTLKWVRQMSPDFSSLVRFILAIRSPQ